MAESYERRRPSYPPELVAWVVERLGLAPGRTVIDLGAGTGKLTRQLVPTGARVIAVEPLDEMLAQLQVVVPGAEALAAAAEELPLRDGIADAVTVASAMHWFDLDRALPEIHRVLIPGGALAVIGQGRDLDDPLQAAVQEILASYLPDVAALSRWRAEIESSPLFGPLKTTESSLEQLLDPDGLAERIGTISYVAGLPDTERAELLVRVRAVGEAQPSTPFPFRYRSHAAVCRALTPDGHTGGR